MRHQNDRHAAFALHGQREIEHLVAQRMGQRGERFVEQEHRAIPHQCARERHALTLATGKFARQALLLARKAGAGKGGRNALAIGGGEPQRRRDAADVAATSRCANRLFSWKIIETGRAEGGSAATSTPSIKTRPDCGASKPAIRLSMVDLPEPLGPGSRRFRLPENPRRR